jgi:hypothetical protein
MLIIGLVRGVYQRPLGSGEDALRIQKLVIDAIDIGGPIWVLESEELLDPEVSKLVEGREKEAVDRIRTCDAAAVLLLTLA